MMSIMGNWLNYPNNNSFNNMMYGMMTGFGGGGWFGGILMFLFWILIVVAVVLFIKWLVLETRGKGSEKSALEILKERYAKGEINKEEFEVKKKDLE